MHCLAKTKSTVFQVAIRNNFHIDAIFVMGTLHTWIICLVDKNLGAQAALPRIVTIIVAFTYYVHVFFCSVTHFHSNPHI